MCVCVCMCIWLYDCGFVRLIKWRKKNNISNKKTSTNKIIRIVAETSNRAILCLWCAQRYSYSIDFVYIQREVTTIMNRFFLLAMQFSELYATVDLSWVIKLIFVHICNLFEIAFFCKTKFSFDRSSLLTVLIYQQKPPIYRLNDPFFLVFVMIFFINFFFNFK